MLSVITVTKNDFDNLFSTFISLCRQKAVFFEWVIIYSDSEDEFSHFYNKCILNYTSKPLSFSIRFTYIPPSGIYEAMNEGIVCSSGSHLLYLNSGDILYSENSLSFACSQINRLSADLYLFASSFHFASKSIAKLPLNPEKAYHLRFFKMPACHQGFIYKKTYLISHNLYFSTKYRLCSDFDHSVRLLSTQPSIASFDYLLTIFDTNGISSRRPFLLFKESTSINFKYAPLFSPLFIAKQICALLLFKFRLSFSRFS